MRINWPRYHHKAEMSLPRKVEMSPERGPEKTGLPDAVE
jgi:hypothetical protein